MNTKIKKARFYRAVSRITKPIAESTHTISKIAFYVTEVETADGVRGQGYLLSFHYSPNAIEGALKDCCNFILDKEYNVYQTVLAKKEWDMEAEYFGNTGLNTCAIAAFNVAMWDAWGHCNGQPVHKLLGCNQDRIPEAADGSVTRMKNCWRRCWITRAGDSPQLRSRWAIRMGLNGTCTVWESAVKSLEAA